MYGVGRVHPVASGGPAGMSGRPVGGSGGHHAPHEGDLPLGGRRGGGDDAGDGLGLTGGPLAVTLLTLLALLGGEAGHQEARVSGMRSTGLQPTALAIACRTRRLGPRLPSSIAEMRGWDTPTRSASSSWERPATARMWRTLSPSAYLGRERVRRSCGAVVSGMTSRYSVLHSSTTVSLCSVL